MTKRNYSQYNFFGLSLILLGLLASLYSADSHYKIYTDPQYSSLCALTNSINCDTVAQSPWAIFLALPVAWWGVLFFLFIFIMLLTTKQHDLHAWRIFFYIMLAASFSSCGLAALSIWKIHALCLVCLTVYLVVFTLNFIAWLAVRRLKAIQKNPKNHQTVRHPYRGYPCALLIPVSGLIILYTFLPHYWVEQFSSKNDILHHGLTQKGHPWIGAQKPQLTIQEFSDYQCFQCAKMHFFLRRLVATHPDTIRLVHRNYPMDHTVNPQVVPEPFHEGSGNMAKIAILASFRNKFWEINDILYALARKKVATISLQVIADTTGLNVKELSASLTDPTIAEMLRQDIWRGMKLGITGTPTFVINGKVYTGTIPANIIEKTLQ